MSRMTHSRHRRLQTASDRDGCRAPPPSGPLSLDKVVGQCEGWLGRGWGQGRDVIGAGASCGSDREVGAAAGENKRCRYGADPCRETEGGREGGRERGMGQGMRRKVVWCVCVCVRAQSAVSHSSIQLVNWLLTLPFSLPLLPLHARPSLSPSSSPLSLSLAPTFPLLPALSCSLTHTLSLFLHQALLLTARRRPKCR